MADRRFPATYYKADMPPRLAMSAEEVVQLEQEGYRDTPAVAPEPGLTASAPVGRHVPVAQQFPGTVYHRDGRILVVHTPAQLNAARRDGFRDTPDPHAPDLIELEVADVDATPMPPQALEPPAELTEVEEQQRASMMALAYKDLVARLRQIDDVAVLRLAARFEQERTPARKTVLDVIQKRLTALEAAA